MFGFIKNWFKPKNSFKEIKQEYKQEKENCISRIEDCKIKQRTNKLMEDFND